jgi:hypothetical protein
MKLNIIDATQLDALTEQAIKEATEYLLYVAS